MVRALHRLDGHSDSGYDDDFYIGGSMRLAAIHSLEFYHCQNNGGFLLYHGIGGASYTWAFKSEHSIGSR